MCLIEGKPRRMNLVGTRVVSAATQEEASNAVIATTREEVRSKYLLRDAPDPTIDVWEVHTIREEDRNGYPAGGFLMAPAESVDETKEHSSQQ